MMRRYLGFIIASLCMLAAQVRSDEIAIVTELNPPLQLSVDGEFSGFAVELVNKVMQSSVLEGDISMIPWARAYKMGLENPNTLIFSMRRTPKRENLFHWVQPLFLDSVIPAEALLRRATTLTFLCKANTQINASNLKELTQHSLSAPRGDYMTEQLLFMVQWSSSRLIQTPNFSDTLELLNNDRVVLALAIGNDTDAILQRYGYQPEDFKVCFREPAPRYDLYFAFSLDTQPQHLSAFKEAFQQIVDSGEYLATYQRWFPSPK